MIYIGTYLGRESRVVRTGRFMWGWRSIDRGRGILTIRGFMGGTIRGFMGGTIRGFMGRTIRGFMGGTIRGFMGRTIRGFMGMSIGFMGRSIGFMGRSVGGSIFGSINRLLWFSFKPKKLVPCKL
jgi:hypothetical protein